MQGVCVVLFCGIINSVLLGKSESPGVSDHLGVYI